MTFLNRIVFLSILLFASYTSAEEIPIGPLPSDVRPVLYDLSLTIIPDQDTFSGTTKIQIEIQKETSVIWIHGKNLSVSKSGIIFANGTEKAVSYKQVDDNGVALVDLPGKVGPQKITLWFQYEAPFNRKLESLYRVDEEGASYAFTQFEAISARQCFPGFDEPGFKTPYDITLTVRRDHTAITTTFPVNEQDVEGGMKRIRFERTELLPTYLIAFAVGPFDVVKGSDIPANEYRSKPVPVRGIAAKGRGKEFTYALENAGPMLVLLEKYFGIGYPFHKLDLIAVPDFEWGAMENVGAITFRDSYLLFDEKKASFGQKKSYATVMAHELAHQWFGNLVTLDWWDDIWLNEGLTSWMDNKIVAEWNPEHRSEIQAVESGLAVMNMDSTDSTHPLHRPVKDSKEIASIADGIIFSKGAAVPLMYEQYLGQENFQKLIRHYIKKHEFGSVDSEDLINSFRETAGDEVSSSIRSFVFQSGVPFVELETHCEGNRATAKYKQSRYIPLGSKGNAKQTWEIPLCLRFESRGQVTQKCTIVKDAEGAFAFADVCPDWVIPNAGGTGYYRWNLSSEGFRMLREKGQSKLTVGEQLSMLDSVKSAFAAGRLSTDETLKALAGFASSETREIAKSPFPLLTFVREYLLDPSQISAFQKYGKDLYFPVYSKLGMDASPSDTEEIKEFRSEVIDFLAHVVRDPEVRKQASERGVRFAGFGTDGKIHSETVDPDLQALVLSVAVQENGEKFMDHLWKLLENSNDATIRRRILYAIGSATNPEMVQKALGLSLQPSLRTNEVSAIPTTLMDRPENRKAVWEWIQKNYDPYTAKLALSDAGGTSLMMADLCSDEDASAVKEFFTPRVKDLPGGNNYLARTLNYISQCSAKRKAHRDSATAFFAAM